MQVQAETEILAAPADVFRAFLEFARSAERLESVQHAEMLTAEPVRVGTRFREIRLHGKQEMTFDFEVVALQPGTSYEVENKHGGVRWHSRYTFHAKGSRTLVHLTMQASPLGLAGWLVMLLVRTKRREMEEQMLADLRGMERAIEAAAEGD